MKIIDIKIDLNKQQNTSNKSTLQAKQNEIHNKPKNKQTCVLIIILERTPVFLKNEYYQELFARYSYLERP